MDPELTQAISESVRMLFLLSFPVILVGAVVGAMASIFQTGLSLHDQGVSYALRLLAILGLGALTLRGGLHMFLEYAGSILGAS